MSSFNDFSSAIEAIAERKEGRKRRKVLEINFKKFSKYVFLIYLPSMKSQLLTSYSLNKVCIMCMNIKESFNDGKCHTT